MSLEPNWNYFHFKLNERNPDWLSSLVLILQFLQGTIKPTYQAVRKVCEVGMMGGWLLWRKGNRRRIRIWINRNWKEEKRKTIYLSFHHPFFSIDVSFQLDVSIRWNGNMDFDRKWTSSGCHFLNSWLLLDDFRLSTSTHAFNVCFVWYEWIFYIYQKDWVESLFLIGFSKMRSS